VARAADLIITSIKSGGKVLIFGNGGSAADAQHIAAELVNRLNYDRPPIAAIALTTDSSIVTSVGNDSSFDQVFERQLRALGRRGDVALAISTSGNSQNVLRAAAAATELGIKSIALAGRDGGQLANAVDVALVVDASSSKTRCTQRREMTDRAHRYTDMSRYKTGPIDLSSITTYPLASRPSKVTSDDFAKSVTRESSLGDFLDSLPNVLATRELRELASLINTARRNGRAIIVGLGGHVIKTGLAPILIDLMHRGYVTALAMNGSAMIHDFEIALVGATS
jgi:D-sedoheptulose 7-phosphate isomerase